MPLWRCKDETSKDRILAGRKLESHGVVDRVDSGCEMIRIYCATRHDRGASGVSVDPDGKLLVRQACFPPCNRFWRYSVWLT